MIESLIFPLSDFVKHVHLLGDIVSINHIKIDGLMLLEPDLPLGTPIVIWGYGYDLLKRNKVFKDPSKMQCVHFQIALVSE